MLDFDTYAIGRGRRCFRDGRVTSVQWDGNSLTASVIGTARRAYRVRIDPRNPAASWCSCPARGRCKHQVAVLLAVLDGHLADPRLEAALVRRLGRSLSEKLTHALDQPQWGVRQGSGSDIVVDVDSLLSGMAKTRVVGQDEEPAFVDHLGCRYRLAFEICADSCQPLELRPVRQYLRADGALGRSESLRLSEPVFAPSELMREVARKVLVLGGRAPAAVFADALPDLPLIAPRSAEPVKTLRPDRLELELIPTLADTRGRRPSGLDLSVRLKASDGDSSVSIDPPAAYVGETRGGATLLLSDKGHLLVGTADSPLRPVAAALTQPRITLEDVAALRNRSSADPDGLVLRYPERIRVIRVASTPVFRLYGGRHLRNAIMTLEAGDCRNGTVGDPPEYRIHLVDNVPDEAAMNFVSVALGVDPFEDLRGGSWVWDVAGAAVELLSFGIALADHGYRVFVPDGNTAKALVRRSDLLSVQMTSGIDWFDLKVRVGDRNVSYALLARIAERGLIEEDERLVALDADEVARIRAIFDTVYVDEEGQIHRSDAASVAAAADLADDLDEEAEEASRRAHAFVRGEARGPVGLPPGLSAVLRPYQVDGFNWLVTLADYGLSGCLADDMGLGKTVQALAFMLHLRGLDPPICSDEQRGDEQRGGFLVVAPVSTLANWRREAARFAPDLSCVVHHGPKRFLAELESVDLVVTSYATALADVDGLKRIRWRLICLDEAQFIKNPGTRTACRLKTIPGDLRLALTGTPVENFSTDLWSIMDFLNPGLLGSLSTFSRRFPRRPKSESRRATRALGLLRSIVAPVLLRRTKEAVAPELPPKTETVVECVMTPPQAQFYETLRVYHRRIVRNAIESRETDRIGAAIFTGLLRLRQAALYPEDANAEGAGIPSTKEAELLSRLEEVVSAGSKVLVFSQFVSALQRMELAVRRLGVETLYLDGGTRHRDRLIERFQTADMPVAFFISLRAGGTGINLTSADYVFICDPWWNPQVERQAVDRAHRIGRTRPVIVNRLVCVGTVEEKVLALQEQKRRLAADLVTENHGGIDLSETAELLALFD